MVDADRAGVREHVVHHVAVDGVAGRLHVVRVERRLAPVLALLVVEVRRAAHGHRADGETFGAPPHVRTVGVHAHGHVLHEAERHAAVFRGLLRGRHLLGGDPLQPARELVQVGMVLLELRDLRAVPVRGGEPVHAFLPRCAPHLERDAPQGERAQVVARCTAELRERRLALGGALLAEDDLERRALGIPCRVDVDRVRVRVVHRHAVMQVAHSGQIPLTQLLEFRDVLRADVGDVQESARLGQVRGGLERGDWRARVDRVDEHEVGAGFGGRVGGEHAQVAVVADAPRPGGTHRVHLRHPAPALLVLHCLRHGDARGGAQQRARDGALAVGERERVVAGRDVVIEAERVDVHVVALRLERQLAEFTGELGAVFEYERDARVGAEDVQLHRLGGAQELDDGGGSQQFVLVLPAVFERRRDRLVGGGIHAERLQHGDEHFVADFHIGAQLVDVRGGDAPCIGEADERAGETLCAFPGIVGRLERVPLLCGVGFGHHCSLSPAIRK